MEKMYIYMRFGLQNNKFKKFKTSLLNLKYINKLIKKYHKEHKDGTNLMFLNLCILIGMKIQLIFTDHLSLMGLINIYNY